MTKAADKVFNAAGQEVKYDENTDRYVPVDGNVAATQPNQGVVAADDVADINEQKDEK